MLVSFTRGLSGVFRNLTHPRAVMPAVLAGGATWVCVESGFDWWWHVATHPYFLLALPAAIVGFFVPIITPVSFYIWGEVHRKKRLIRAGVLIAQAEAIAWLFSSTLKAVTGRVQPEFYTLTSTIDNSREWLFGFMRHGIFWGWPSSHTAVAVAMSAMLIVLYPKKPLLALLALLYATYIALGVSVSIHWFSDMIAGVVVGCIAAWAVYTAHRRT